MKHDKSLKFLKFLKYLIMGGMIFLVSHGVRNTLANDEEIFENDELLQENIEHTESIEYSELDEMEISKDIDLREDEKKILLVEENRVPTQEFLGSFNAVWNASLKAFSEYELETINLATGQIKTRWRDNTEQENFLRGDKDELGSSQVCFLVIVRNKSKNNANNQNNENSEKTKVTILKKQKIINKMRHEWIDVNSDDIMEKTFFYRINQLLVINKKAEEKKS